MPVKFHVFFLVLDPRLKLNYYRETGWDRVFIAQARTTITTHYRTKYAPPPGEEPQVENDQEDELVAYIYKRRRVQRVDELEEYLKTSCAPPFDTNTTVLTWWKVCG